MPRIAPHINYVRDTKKRGRSQKANLDNFLDDFIEGGYHVGSSASILVKKT